MELEKQRQERERNMKLQAVRENNDHLLQERIQGYVDVLNRTDAKVERVKAQQKQEAEAKKDFEIMREMDREDNRNRIMQMQEFKRQLLKERIERDNEKTRYIREEQANNILKRQKLRREMNEKREKMIEEFHKSQRKMAKTSASGFGKSGKLNFFEILLTDSLSSCYRRISPQRPLSADIIEFILLIDLFYLIQYV